MKKIGVLIGEFYTGYGKLKTGLDFPAKRGWLMKIIN